MQFAPRFETGGDLNDRVRKMLFVKPEIRDFRAQLHHAGEVGPRWASEWAGARSHRKIRKMQSFAALPLNAL